MVSRSAIRDQHHRTMMPRLDLPTVTLCAVTSVNLSATVAALEACLDQAEFDECLLFTHVDILPDNPRIRVISVPQINSAHAYSLFMLQRLVLYVRSQHCLVVQWDGFIIDSKQWRTSFLDFDYIGAPWPQFVDGHNVGNGGFSLRSRRLLEACTDPRFDISAVEDVAICRTNRRFLEQVYGISFADELTAGSFAFERTEPVVPTFGFHGAFNMMTVLGRERFCQLYETLDERKTGYNSYKFVMIRIGDSGRALKRRLRSTVRYLWHQFR